MKALLVAASVSALLVTAPAWAQNSPNSSMSGQSNSSISGQQSTGSSHQLSSQDEQFIKEAAQGNAAEVQLGELAAKKGGTTAVKEFGRWMASSHGFANKELKDLTQNMHGQTPDMAPNSEQKSEMQKLEKLSGHEFDREYLHMMLEDHQKDIQKFEKEAQNGQDQMVKMYAQRLVPVLKQHLAEVQDLTK